MVNAFAPPAMSLNCKSTSRAPASRTRAINSSNTSTRSESSTGATSIRFSVCALDTKLIHVLRDRISGACRSWAERPNKIILRFANAVSDGRSAGRSCLVGDRLDGFCPSMPDFLVNISISTWRWMDGSHRGEIDGVGSERTGPAKWPVATIVRSVQASASSIVSGCPTAWFRMRIDSKYHLGNERPGGIWHCDGQRGPAGELPFPLSTIHSNFRTKRSQQCVPNRDAPAATRPTTTIGECVTMTGVAMSGRERYAPLYRPEYERDACGVGLVVDILGRPSRDIVERALGGLVNLTHRGGVGADERTGDGAGVLTQIPHALFASDLARLGAGELVAGEYGVAMCFLPRDTDAADEARFIPADAVSGRGLDVIGWREVVVDSSVLGRIAAETQPGIAQLLIRRPDGRDAEAFERDLMLARKAVERAAGAAGIDGLFVVSCSARTIIYKGFCLPEDLAAFYQDLRDPDYTSAIALFHQRYSTNTLPTWAMAQPFRFVAHNGEINTVQGNRNWMVARTPALAIDGVADADELAPVVSLTGSDSLSLDNTLELLIPGGRSLPHALMMLVPAPWEPLPEMAPDLRAFYDFHAGLVEQWDGPAALAFSDGVLAGATLDRNGLRPLRYAITEDGLLIAGSEAGTVAVDQAKIVEKGRLGPGQMIVVDTRRGIVLHNHEVKHEVASKAPYAEWLCAGRMKLSADEP